MPTLAGHGLGARADRPDPRDHMYGAARPVALPPFVDLRKKLPVPVWDQGETNACGGMAGAALMSFLFPQVIGGFSAMQIYYDVRAMENDTQEDNGVETRDVVKALAKTGAAPIGQWPFDPAHIKEAPSGYARNNALQYRLSSYQRLNSADDYFNCLADGFPFILGFHLTDTFEGDVMAKTGIMTFPDPKTDKVVGRHDVLVVGYDRTFKHTPFFEASGIDAAKVDDTMLLVRNSWGPSWSPKFRGHFWLPLSYAVNKSTGGDAWTGRVSPELATAHEMAVTAKPVPTKAQLDAGFRAGRQLANESGYGMMIGDDTVRKLTDSVVTAAFKA